MAKFLPDTTLDQALDYIAGCDLVVACDGQPSSYADATTDNGSGGNALGETSASASDFSKAAGDTSGRKINYGGASDVDVDVDGTADHLAFVNNGDSTLRAVTTVTSQSVSAGGAMDFAAVDVLEVQDPS